MTHFIPYGRQDISEEDVNAVVDVLRSDWLTQGPAIDQFEAAMAARCGAKYAVAVSNATAALHVGCLSLGLRAGDLLWTVPNTFVASANCGLYCGAEVDFVDIDSGTWNMSLTALETKLARAKKTGRLPKVVVPVHFAGQSPDVLRMRDLAHAYGFAVLEDASHAVGAEYRGAKVGCCQFSDLAVFSFHPVKIMTTGEGGMILTNREDLRAKLVRLRTHGITREKDLMTTESHGPWYYEQLDLGFNYRITDLQAALGLSQLKRVEEFVRRRRYLAAVYDRELRDLPLSGQEQHSDSLSAYHLYPIRIDSLNTKIERLEVFQKMRAAQIGVNVHYIPVHLQPYYRALGFKQGDFPEAERYYAGAMSLPLYSRMKDEEQERVISVLRAIFK